MAITPDERRALAALEAVYGLLSNIVRIYKIDEAVIIRMGDHHFNLPGSSTNIRNLLDYVDEVLGVAKERDGE